MPDPTYEEAKNGAAQWFYDRLDESLRSRARVTRPLSGPQMEFLGPHGWLSLGFTTPHTVVAKHVIDGSPDLYRWTYNIAMNLQEITDLIRSTLEPRS